MDEAVAEAAATQPAADVWTPERVASELQSALQEVLGRTLEPSEPFMSGKACARQLCAVKVLVSHLACQAQSYVLCSMCLQPAHSCSTSNLPTVSSMLLKTECQGLPAEHKQTRVLFVPVLHVLVCTSMPAGGLDSLGAVEYVNLVGRRLNLQLPSTLVFDYPTVDAITTFLATKLAAKQPPSTQQKATAPRQAAARPGMPAPQKSLAPPAATAQPQEVPVSILATLLWPFTDEGASITLGTACTSLAGSLPQRDCIIPIPGNRWNPDTPAGEPHDVANSIASARFGAFLHDVEFFDAAAFGLGTGEAVATDPQHRLLLASAAQLLSTPGAFSPGSSGSTAAGSQRSLSDTGVFVGISWTEYYQLGRTLGQPMGANSAQGAVLSVACGRQVHLGMVVRHAHALHANMCIMSTMIVGILPYSAD